jgi:uncharacterized membrane-anchored protein
VSTTRARSTLRRSNRRRSELGIARVDARTKDLVSRARPGDVAVIDHEDLDRVAAEGLVRAGGAGVVNASASITGRYPNLGPLILTQAGVPLVDSVGRLVMRKVREGDRVRLEGDRIFVGDRLVGVGTRHSRDSVLRDMEAAKSGLGDRFDGFARNTLEYLQQERDLLFGGAGLPQLDHDLSGRPALVVVRGYGYREDLAALRAYIRDVRPVLVGVDGGADALLDEGYVPDLIVGDMDSVSDRALDLARAGRRRRRPPVVIVHAYDNAHAPGRERLDRLGVPYKVARAVGTSEDLAFLLAHDKRADLIVAVGSHGNLREFLDKGREGMASTFHVRLRVGEILLDAKGVSRLYAGGSRRWETWLLVGSALVAVAIIVLVSPSLRLYVSQNFHAFLDWLRNVV